jgi:hypothetical protein
MSRFAQSANWEKANDIPKAIPQEESLGICSNQGDRSWQQPKRGPRRVRTLGSSVFHAAARETLIEVAAKPLVSSPRGSISRGKLPREDFVPTLPGGFSPAGKQGESKPVGPELPHADSVALPLTLTSPNKTVKFSGCRRLSWIVS